MGIIHIAQKAGVSVATVSRVLNGTKPVSEALKVKVLQVIAEDGYVANYVARSMVLKKTFTVGLILPHVSEMYHQTIFSGVEEKLEQENYKVIVCRVKDQSDQEKVYLDLLMENRIDGVILMHETTKPGIYRQLEGSHMPIVLCSIDIPNTPFPRVCIDDFRASYDGTAYLTGLGHRHIGLIAGEGYTAGDRRVEGFLTALTDAGIDHDSRNIVAGHYTIESGRVAMLELLERSPGLTAVFVASDEMAIGAMAAITGMGLTVPGNISVLGFDGIDIGPYLFPPLTTVGQPIRDMGRLSAELLLTLISAGNLEQDRVIMAHSIIERSSCRRVC